MTIRLPIKFFIAMIATACCLSGQAFGAEEQSPFLPGISTGIPMGALPPPGLYMTNEFFIARSTSLAGADGQSIPFKVQNTVYVPSLLWVPGWHLLGAQYGMGILEAYAEHDVDTTAIGGKSTRTAGVFNTIVTPAILSWNLGHGWFTSAAMTVYLPNGHHSYANGAPTQENYANDFWTAEPSIAISYLANGWNFTINNAFDFNRTNPTTNYHSGSAYYLDATAAKTIGRWTFGVIGNYSRQFTDDYQNGAVVGNGNRFEHILIGPLLSYNFGPAQVTLRYLQNLRSRNDINVSFFHASVSFRF